MRWISIRDIQFTYKLYLFFNLRPWLSRYYFALQNWDMQVTSHWRHAEYLPPWFSKESSNHLCSLQLSPPIPRNRFYHGIHFHCLFKDMRLLQLQAVGNPSNFSHTRALHNSPPAWEDDSRNERVARISDSQGRKLFVFNCVLVCVIVEIISTVMWYVPNK